MDAVKLKIRYYPEIFRDGEWIRLQNGEPLHEGEQYDFVIHDKGVRKYCTLKLQYEEELGKPQ